MWVRIVQVWSERKNVHVGRESIQCLVEVVHLNHDASRHSDAEHVRARVYELVITRQRQLHGDTEALDGHDRYGADERADGDIDEGIRATITGCHTVDHDQRENEDGEAVH